MLTAAWVNRARHRNELDFEDDPPRLARGSSERPLHGRLEEIPTRARTACDLVSSEMLDVPRISARSNFLQSHENML